MPTRSVPDRQAQAGDQAAAFSGQQFQASVMGTGDTLDNGQSEAGAAGVGARILGAGERALEAFDFAFGYARSAIEDIDDDFVIDRTGFDGQFRAAVFARIFQQIDDGA